MISSLLKWMGLSLSISNDITCIYIHMYSQSNTILWTLEWSMNHEWLTGSKQYWGGEMWQQWLLFPGAQDEQRTTADWSLLSLCKTIFYETCFTFTHREPRLTTFQVDPRPIFRIQSFLWGNCTVPNSRTMNMFLRNHLVKKANSFTCVAS